jgi:heptosyltransferase-2
MRILIIKTGAIGDVVMCMPVVTAIRNRWPDARITWLCGKQVLPLLERVEGIDERIAVDEAVLLKGSVPERVREIMRVWRRLAGRPFDIGLYYYFSRLYKILTLTARVAEWRSFEKTGGGRLNPVPGQHHSVAYVQTLLQEEGPLEGMPQYPSYRKSPSAIPEKGPLRVALACGGAKNLLRNDDLRRWPAESYRELGMLISAAGHRLILTGGPGDTWVREAFGGMDFEDHIGRHDLVGFVDLLAGCNLLITHDSGPLHLADLAACPVLGLFGPTMPAEKTSLQPRSAWIWGGENLGCRPCYDGRTYARCQTNLCLRSVSAEEVWKKAQTMLES